jgi:hypothetical protein
MFEKAKPGRDAFTFSLGGITAIAPFVAAPAIAHDRINKIRDSRLNKRDAADGPRPVGSGSGHENDVVQLDNCTVAG